MKSFTLEDWKKEIQLALSDGKYIHLVNHEIPELKKYMETGIGDVFLKFADAIELLTSITGINSIPYIYHILWRHAKHLQKNRHTI